MKRIGIKRLSIVFIAFVAMCSFFSICDASSIGISATATSLTVGYSATITVSGNDAIGRVNVSSSNSNIVSVSQSSLWIEGSASFKVTAKTVGSATITIAPTTMANGAGTDVSVPAKSITIYSKAVYVDTRSTNNNLSSITIEGQTLDFNKDNTAYTLDVGYEVENLNISGIAEDTKANVTIEGGTALVPGENIVKVICTSERGAQKVYEIKVNKAKNPDDINTKLKSLTISNATLKDSFSSDVLEYLCNDISADIDSIVLEYETEIEGAKVEITGNEKLKSGINHVILKVTSKDESTTGEYDIIIYKSSQIFALAEVKELSTMEKITNWMMANKIIVLSLIVIFILIIVIIILVVKNIKRNKYNNERYKYEETEEIRNRRRNLNMQDVGEEEKFEQLNKDEEEIKMDIAEVSEDEVLEEKSEIDDEVIPEVEDQVEEQINAVEQEEDIEEQVIEPNIEPLNITDVQKENIEIIDQEEKTKNFEEASDLDILKEMYNFQDSDEDKKI